MNRLLLTLAVLACFGLTSFSTSQVLDTRLRVTVIDDLGNFVEGAQVTLYSTEEDYRNNTNPVASCDTDKKGRSLFENLEAKSYFIEAHKGELNNNGAGVKIEALLPKKLNKVNTIIE